MTFGERGPYRSRMTNAAQNGEMQRDPPKVTVC